MVVGSCFCSLSKNFSVGDVGLGSLHRRSMIHSEKKRNGLLEVKSELIQQLERLTSEIKKVDHLLDLSYHVPDFANDTPSDEELMELKSNFFESRTNIE